LGSSVRLGNRAPLHARCALRFRREARRSFAEQRPSRPARFARAAGSGRLPRCRLGRGGEGPTKVLGGDRVFGEYPVGSDPGSTVIDCEVKSAGAPAHAQVTCGLVEQQEGLSRGQSRHRSDQGHASMLTVATGRRALRSFTEPRRNPPRSARSRNAARRARPSISTREPVGFSARASCARNFRRLGRGLLRRRPASARANSYGFALSGSRPGSSRSARPAGAQRS